MPFVMRLSGTVLIFDVSGVLWSAWRAGRIEDIMREYQDQTTKDLLQELQHLKQKQRDIGFELTTRLTNEIKLAIRDGLVKLNFAAPSGYLKYIKDIK